MAHTGRNTEVEEVLSALSLLLNGGGVAQLKVIETELSHALGGNETQIRDLIVQLNTFVGGLDKQKSEIVRVGAQPHALPADEDHGQVGPQDQDEHGEGEQVEVGEEPGVALLLGHIADGEDVDEQADARDDQGHHGG